MRMHYVITEAGIEYPTWQDFFFFLIASFAMCGISFRRYQKKNLLWMISFPIAFQSAVMEDKKHTKESKKAPQKIQEAVDNVRASVVPLRILLVGPTGSGKSSLIGKIFGFGIGEGPKTGYGQPVTPFDAIDKEWRHPEVDSPIILHDSKGSELGDKDYDTKLARWLDERRERSEKQLAERVHLIWYFVDLGLGRFQSFDERILNEVIAPRNISVMIILTKRDLVTKTNEGQMRDLIALKIPATILKGVFAVSIQDNQGRIESCF